MADQHCKRNAETVTVTEESSSSNAASGILSKIRRRTTASLGGCKILQLSLSDTEFHDLRLSDFSQDRAPAGSPVDSMNAGGTGMAVSAEDCSVSCGSCNEEANEVVFHDSSTLLDLEAKGFKATDSTYAKINWLHKLSEYSGDSEDMELLEKSSPALGCSRRILPNAKMPPEDEMEEFFSVAEKSLQKRFAEKYNYDIVKDMPLEGPYQWVRLRSCEQSN